MNWTILLVSFVLTSIFTIETLGAALVGGAQPFTFYCDYEPRSASGLEDFSMINQPYDHKDLTYRVTIYSTKLSEGAIDDIISQALGAWAAVTDLTFTKKNSKKADIEIKFLELSHGCQRSFDGPGGVLGHASTGYVHFDDSENWSTRINSNVVNLYSIAIHEIGHALGLGHSSYREAIMYRSYDPRNAVTKLHSDDIGGIQRLYGVKTTSDVGGGVSVGNDCWTTGCQLNSWAVVGCAQYQRVQKSKTACSGGYLYECCTGSSERREPRTQPTGSARPNSGSWSECWTTGCQLNTWAVVGCGHYGMTEIERHGCAGGNTYKCCK